MWYDRMKWKYPQKESRSGSDNLWDFPSFRVFHFKDAKMQLPWLPSTFSWDDNLSRVLYLPPYAGYKATPWLSKYTISNYIQFGVAKHDSKANTKTLSSWLQAEFPERNLTLKVHTHVQSPGIKHVCCFFLSLILLCRFAWVFCLTYFEICISEVSLFVCCLIRFDCLIDCLFAGWLFGLCWQNSPENPTCSTVWGMEKAAVWGGASEPFTTVFVHKLRNYLYGYSCLTLKDG